MQRPKPIVLAGIAGAIILLIVAALLLARGRSGNQDRLPDQVAETEAEQGPETRCSSQRTYDAIKRELFRQAATIRGGDQAAFDRIATYSAVRMERPVLRSQDEDLGTTGCSGLLTLDLPPGVAVVGGRRSLSAEIGYLLHRAADGSGDVVMLEGADPIIVPLATLARTATAVAIEPDPNANMVEGLGNEVLPLPGPVTAEPPTQTQPEPAPGASPSFDCADARTRSEFAICSSEGLAALDREMAARFGDAMQNASSEQRRLLETTRNRFLRFREGCRSEDCIADTYRGRIREIDDIMAGRWRRPR